MDKDMHSGGPQHDYCKGQNDPFRPPRWPGVKVGVRFWMQQYYYFKPSVIPVIIMLFLKLVINKTCLNKSEHAQLI